MLKKIIYFDEDSVTDYVQIKMGGNLERTTELLDDTKKCADTNGTAKISAGIAKMFKTIIGFGSEVSIEGNAYASFQRNKMIKSIIQNTILTDFMDLIEQSEDENKDDFKIFSDYKISVEKDSLSYFVMISPYLTMLKNNGAIQAGEFDIALEKVDEAIKGGKGYYEFIGNKGNSTVIFRFNINAFKNNYRIADLVKMKLTLYAIQVGETTIDQLNVNNEFNIEKVSSNVKDNPSYEKKEDNDEQSKNDSKKLKVYDVLLAGVV